jgi:ATP-dependent Lhr-like helicase
VSAELSRLVGQAFFGSFKELRPIQMAAIPPILAGRDVLVRSATASGKTEAAVAPLMDRLLPTIRAAAGVTIVVVSPTRALVNDLCRRLEEPLARLGVRVGIRHGERDHLALVDKPHVLLTTPESLDGLVGRRDPALQGVKAVVLDEAHLLFNTQRGLQVGITLHRLEMWLEAELQTVGLSATIGSAAEVWRFFRPGRSVVDVAVPGGRPLEYRIHLDVSTSELVDVVKSFADKKLLVFVNSRKECEAITDLVRRSGIDPTRVFAHHSSLANDLRLHVEETFSAITSGVCVATPTLELGIDIGSIDLVVLYGVPANWQSLAQRVGRGNRRTEYIEALLCIPKSPAKSTTLVDRLTFQALLAEAFQEHPRAVTAQELLGAYAQQLCSELDAQGQFIGINKLAAIGAPWPHLDRATTIEVLDALVDEGVVQKHPAYNRYGPDEGLHELHDRWQVWSNFVGSGQSIDVRTNQRHVGQIGTRNLAMLCPGDVFLLGGRRWKIERISPWAISVASTNTNPTRDVEQGGSRMMPSQTSAEWIRRVICDGIEAASVYPRAEASKLTGLIEPLRTALESGLTPVIRHGDKYHYLTFAGPLINGALAARFGLPKMTNAVVLTTEREVDFSNVPPSISELMPGTLSSPGERSQFQNYLPDRMIEAEDRSIIDCDPMLAEVLRRLCTSPVVELQATHLLKELGL